MRCDQAASVLMEMVDGTADPAAPGTHHVERCLRCQAELAQHRRVRRGLGQLRQHVLEPDAELLEQLLAAVGAEAAGEGPRAGLTRHRVVYVAAATAAGAAGALVLASRSRRTRLVPTG